MTDLVTTRREIDDCGKMLKAYERKLRRAEQSTRGYRDINGNWQCGLYAFVQYYWDVLEPETRLVTGWPLEVLCQHLEAVTYGEITRLLINISPGSMKSLITDVFWPAWEWGPMNKAHLRYVAFSYASTLTERDNLRFATLLISDKYQSMWGHRVTITARGAQKVSNITQGWKLASSVGGVGTGERGDRIVCDDPHNVKESESETVRKETVRWFRESMSNRLNDMRTGAIVVIMQRVHEEDVAGVILSLGLGYCHLRIPMEYDPDYQLNDDGTVRANSLGWVDPRFDPDDIEGCRGVLAWPERWPPDVIEDTKAAIGPFAWNSQYQQSPVPRGGGIFRREWWQLWDAPDGKFPVFDYIIASLDSAFTMKEQNDPSGFTVWGVFVHPEHGQKRIMLIHAWRKYLQFSGPRSERLPKESVDGWRRRTQNTWGLMEWVADTCRRFKVDKLLIEAKANGISAGQELVNRYGREGWAIQLVQVTGDKVARALAAQPTFSQLLVYSPARDWADMVMDEMATFPYSPHDDLTDSATQAINYLRLTGLAQTDEEVRYAETQVVTHRPKLKAIYPV